MELLDRISECCTQIIITTCVCTKRNASQYITLLEHYVFHLKKNKKKNKKTKKKTKQTNKKHANIILTP